MWSDHPRVITYAHRTFIGRKVEKRQELLGAAGCTPDILVLELDIGPKQEPLYIINVYNAPQGYKRAGEAISLITQASNLMQKRSLILGHRNLHHTDWNNWTINPSEAARNFADWIAEEGAFYQLEPGIATHNRNGVIDLAIASATMTPHIIECYIEPALHTTSDHETICTKIELGSTPQQGNSEPGKFLLAKMDEKQFFAGLETQRDLVKTCLANVQTYI